MNSFCTYLNNPHIENEAKERSVYRIPIHCHNRQHDETLSCLILLTGYSHRPCLLFASANAHSITTQSASSNNSFSIRDIPSSSRLRSSLTPNSIGGATFPPYDRLDISSPFSFHVKPML